MKIKLTKEEYEVEAIINDRKRRRINKRTKKFRYYNEYLTKWKNCNEATWEKEKTLYKCKVLIDKYLNEKKEKEKAKNERKRKKYKKSSFISKSPKNLGTSKKIFFNVEKIESKKNEKVEKNSNLDDINNPSLISSITNISNEQGNLKNNIILIKNGNYYKNDESSDEIDSNVKTEATPLKFTTFLNKKTK